MFSIGPTKDLRISLRFKLPGSFASPRMTENSSAIARTNLQPTRRNELHCIFCRRASGPYAV